MGKGTENRMLRASIETLLKQNENLKAQLGKGGRRDHKGTGSGTSTSPGDEPCEILHLNVGGTEMFTSRQTLTAVKGSNLAELFSGHVDDQLLRDDKGRIFLDLDPLVFVKVIEYLQAVKISNNDGDDDLFLSPPSAQESSDDHDTLDAYMTFFGLIKTQEVGDGSHGMKKEHFFSYFIQSGNEEEIKIDLSNKSESEDYYFPDSDDDKESVSDIEIHPDTS